MKKKSLNVKKKILNNLLYHLRDKKINNIYKKFSKNLSEVKNSNNFAVAVSGGPDSLSLSFLSKCFAVKNNKKIKFFIVDHKLRKNSLDEARLVKKKLLDFDINCKILSWVGKKPKTGIQSKARNKRYELIFNECKKNKIDSLFTGHHFDDLYENFYLRILRGSGLKGISSFTNVKSEYNNKLNIYRPLININKNELIFLSKTIFKFYVLDPTNKDTIFKRTQIRNLLKEFNKLGLSQDKIQLTLKNLRDANYAIETSVNKNIYLNSTFLEKKKLYMLNQSFFDNPSEVLIRSFSKILVKSSGNYYPPRSKKILYFLKIYKKKRPFKVTLGGCVVEKVNNSVIIYKESKKKH